MVFKIFSVIGIMLILSSCYFFRRPTSDTSLQYFRLIVNQMDKDIILKAFGEFDHRVQIIEQDSSWLMERNGISQELKPFEYMNLALDSVVVYSVEGVTLKVWRKSEQSEEGKHFFNENSWQKKEWKEGIFPFQAWIFKLVPEDIQD